MTTDLLGRTLTDAETKIVASYTALKELAGRDDLPPCAAANIATALSAVAVVVTDLALDFEHLTDLGC